MGEVLLKYRVMPEGPETDLDALEKAIEGGLPAGARLERSQQVPFAFGMKALVATIVVVDEEGNNDKVEEALHKVPHVQGVELVEMGRLM